jgi:glycine cleavage system H lipoate-binding protein
MHEYFTFVDFVRDSKLMEYGVAFLFIGLFAVFYKILQQPEAHEAAMASAVSKAVETIKGLLAPDGFAYHFGHAWAKVEGPALAAVGIDDFAAKLVGPVEAVALPEVGAAVKQGERAWTLKVAGKMIDMLSPLDGTVKAINPAAAAAIADDPYGKGWLFKVETPRLRANLKNLMTGALARTWVEQTVDALYARAGDQLGAVAADGGSPVSGMARNIDPAQWDKIARECFLTNE